MALSDNTNINVLQDSSASSYSCTDQDYMRRIYDQHQNCANIYVGPTTPARTQALRDRLSQCMEIVWRQGTDDDLVEAVTFMAVKAAQILQRVP